MPVFQYIESEQYRALIFLIFQRLNKVCATKDLSEIQWMQTRSCCYTQCIKTEPEQAGNNSYYIDSTGY